MNPSLMWATAVAFLWSSAWTPLVISIPVALVFRLLVVPLLRRLSKVTATTLDDAFFDAIAGPATLTILGAGAWYSLLTGLPDPLARAVPAGVLATLLVLAWTRAAATFSHEVLAFLARNHGSFPLVETRTLPLFDILGKAVIYGGAAYFLLLAWDIDVTAWLASAGVVGIAVGFAARDSLANLFAGLFIIADSPYKIGDYLVLDIGTRGRVTQIGLRSTRMLTRDDVEVTLPNSVMANARITNQSGGPDESMRVRCAVEVSYDSDLEHVRAVLMEVTARQPLLLTEPAERRPRVRFRSFEGSGIKVEVLAWVHRPEDVGRAVDGLVTGVHAAFRVTGIEIPFPQVVVHRSPGDPQEPSEAET